MTIAGQCPSGCKVCPDATICSTCLDTYVLNPATNLCNSCANIIPNCLSCSSSSGVTVCVNCSVGFTLDQTTCTSAVQSCADVNCATCLSDIKICIACLDGYYVASDATCMTCGTIANCKACSNSTTCTTCLDGSSLTINGTCVVPCHVDYCQTCKIIDICAVCLTGYTLDSVNNKCIPGTSCLDPYCIDCADPKVCKACAGGYALDASGTCARINGAACKDPNCEACNVATDIC